MAELVWEGKYDAGGHRRAPLKAALPFQTVETVNESAQQRQHALDLYSASKDPEWRNRLIWGDKKYVLPSLLPEFAGRVDLVYIDPPFASGQDFSLPVRLNGDDFVKEPSLIEVKAYRDTWGKGLDSYLIWFADSVQYLYELLSHNGSIYVHLDWHVGHYAKAILDEVFGQDNFRNEIVWHYYNKFQGNVNRFASNHDVIFWYSKSDEYSFTPQKEKRPEGKVKQLRREWDSKEGKLVNTKDEQGHVVYQETDERTADDVWRVPMLQPADRTENLGFPTQKRRSIVERIIRASSREDDLVLDCFVGSGTTAEAAELLGRRWIACDLSRFSVHTTRKRLLRVENVTPFEVQNLGKYERQLWQESEFGSDAEARTVAYRKLILDLYKATSLEGSAWIHGVKSGAMVHVGSVDAPVTMSDVTNIIVEASRAVGPAKGNPAAIDVLGWDFAFEVHEVASQKAAEANISLHFVRIPREVLDKRAVEQGDVLFFELAALAVNASVKKQTVTLKLTNFVIPVDDVPEDVQNRIKKWSEWIDYWAVDWDNKGDAFHNEWQAFRSRHNEKLDVQTSHAYSAPGTYRIVVKVIDILGNDTTKTIVIEVN
ncbi:MAG: DNA methyltransferase [Actinomycetota bacterium]